MQPIMTVSNQLLTKAVFDLPLKCEAVARSACGCRIGDAIDERVEVKAG